MQEFDGIAAIRLHPGFGEAKVNLSGEPPNVVLTQGHVRVVLGRSRARPLLGRPGAV